MRRVALRNLAAHKVRLLLTVVSVLLGTAFVAGSFVFTDTLRGTFDKIFANAYQGVDVRVDARAERGAGVPLAVVDRIRAVPGVSRVQVEASGPVVLIRLDGTAGKAVHGGGAPSVGSVYTRPDQRIGAPIRFETGGPPTASGQVAINSGAAKLGHIASGAHVKVLVPSSGIYDVTVSGIYHTASQTGGYIGLLFSQEQALSLFTDGRHVTAVDVVGNGSSPARLRDRIVEAIPADLQAKTGDRVRADTKSTIETALSFINYFLLAFGFIALLVGTFIIYNTFSMIVAQRSRELALLRAVGADRQQIRRSVLVEAGVIGALGSALGVAGGVGLAVALRAILDTIGVGLPSGPLQVTPRTILIGIGLGVLVTLLSADAPARRAAKTPPVAAMREEFAALGASLRRRTAVGCAIGALGVAAAVAGELASSAGTGASLVGLGLLGVGAAALLVSPALSRTVIGLMGVVVTKPFGAVGRLARTNAVRNPRRTAATAFALTLGLLLVSGIAVVGASAKKSINAIVDNQVTADYVLTGTDNSPLPVGAARAASRVPGVGSFVQIYHLDSTANGRNVSGDAVDGTLADVNSLTLRQGTATTSGRNLLVSQNTAESKHWTLGRPVTLSQPGGHSVTAIVTGIYRNNPLFPSWIVSGDVYRQLTASNRYEEQLALVKAAPATNLATLRADLERAVDPYYVVDVQDKEQFKGQQASQINGLLGVLYGLLGLAIVIAILGVINTLALSVVERRRELGMLRAVGVLRGQVRRTCYLESLLIAVFGALVGVAIGLIFGALFTHTLRDSGLDSVEVPWGQAIAFVLVAAAVGVVAALGPAFRAARTRPLDAIAET